MSTGPGLPPLDVSHEDDPRVVREAATEDYAAHVVPRSWRLRPLSLSGAWWALASAMFWLIVSALVALTVGTRDAIIGMVASVVVYGAINAVLQKYAARTGTTVSLFSRGLFGSAGGLAAPLMVAAIATYFAVFEGSVIAVAFDHYFGGGVKLWYLVVVAYSVPLVFGGVRAFLDKFNGLLFPFYVLGLGAAVVWAAVRHGFGTHWLTQAPAAPQVSGPGWWWAFTVYLGDWVLMLATWDFARFGRPTRRDTRVNGWVTFGPAFYVFTILVNGLAGIFVALTIPSGGALSELSGVIGIVQLMGLWGVLFVWVSQTRINTANFYLATTNLENVFAQAVKVRLPRVVWTVIVGALVYVIMLSDVFTYLLTALRYQSVVCVTWTACVLVSLARTRIPAGSTGPEWRPGRVPAVRGRPLLAWLLGTATGMVLLAIGDAASWTTTWALPLAFVVTAAATWLLPARDAGPVRPHDPRAEVDDVWEARVRCHRCGKSYVAVEVDRDPSAGHRAICAGCAQGSTAFLRAARAERAAVVQTGKPRPLDLDVR